MKFFLWSLLMISSSVLLSGILVGLIRSFRTIKGCSFIFLGGSNESSLAGATVPLFFLRVGAFSVFGLWISPAIFGNTEREIVFAGITIGLFFALVNTLYERIVTVANTFETATQTRFQRPSSAIGGDILGGGLGGIICGIVWNLHVSPRTVLISPVDFGLLFIFAGMLAAGLYAIMCRLAYALQQRVTFFVFGLLYHRKGSWLGWLVMITIGLGIGIHFLLTVPLAPQWYSFFVGGSVGQAGVVRITPNDEYILGGIKNRDGWIVKLDPSGKVLWQRTFGGSKDYDKFCAIQLIPDGGVLAVGLRHKHAWISRLTAQGEVLWERFLFDKAEIVDSTIHVTPTGLYTIVGRPHLAIAWEVTFNLDGQQISERAVGNKSPLKTTYSMPDNSILTTENRADYGESSIYVVKRDVQGQLQWKHAFDKRYTARDFDKASAIQPTPDGGYIVAGHTTRGHGPLGAWIFKANQEGQIVWEENFSGDPEHYFKTYSIDTFQVTKDGGCLLVGSRGWKTWIMKRDNSGTLEWERTFNNVLHTFSLQETTLIR